MQVIFQQWQSRISRLSWWFTMGLSFTRYKILATDTTPCAGGTSAKDVAYFERTSAVSGTKHFNFHILQAPFSPKAFLRSYRRHHKQKKNVREKKTKDFTGSFKHMTSFSSILVIKGNGPYIRRKYQKSCYQYRNFTWLKQKKKKNQD